ncbi:methylenetetrahydrofolate reductase [Pyrobaculum neutrophilum]|uniref:Uncharacterized protein n=1 Tax=Pyrobaculum neutrophilum (strain DSM 2338 / JCM 9278 / NBRC 100436 / V24Sta) TaxID=444157 RepID=B1YD20_PYRNV|nr:methylenetetrahydrofolate reductase [Pyrobaculum neutrophilum]ACB39683.1 conserved hypothetical protein [Pyrobaculum neutrophilum V24Sta]
MEVIAEITPLRDRDKVLRKLEAIKPYVEKVDIPESPGGKPTAHSLAVGVLAKQLGLEPIVHIRLLDVNKTGFKSLLGGAHILNIKYVVVLQGDPPAEGKPVGEVATEDAVAEAKKMGFVAGALLSFKRNYRERIAQLGADFYLALHLTDPRQLDGLPPAVYPYIMIKTGNNAALLERLRQTAVDLQQALKLVEELDGLVPGVVLSAPGDFEALLAALREVKRRRS